MNGIFDWCQSNKKLVNYKNYLLINKKGKRK